MDWVLSHPQIHNMFSSLGVHEADGYHIFKNCNDTLEKILDNIRNEDKQLRTCRRSISIGKNISKDLIPLLIHTTEDKTIELLIEILLNLSIPLECLLSLDITAKTDFGRHIIFELNMLLHSCKAAFTDRKVTKVLIDCFKKNIENRCNNEIQTDQCNNISNCLLVLRNILHIPEMIVSSSSNGGTSPSLQNQVLWNMFSQSIDKILIKLMTIPEAHYWAMTMVQVIPLLYRDQHVTTLHKLLNLWLESSVSDSSEDNESNTSPPDRGSDDSSPMLTSDPPSDSSDTGGSGKSNDDPKQEKKDWQNNTGNVNGQEFVHPGSVVKSVSATRKPNKNQKEASEGKDSAKNDSSDTSSSTSNSGGTNKVKKTTTSENSDCGYVTQIENQGSISTSSNEDEVPAKKSVHQKPHGHKQRATTKSRTGYTLQEKKRKKLVKRGKSNIINVQGLLHKTPTNEDISNVLKEFTVDFLLKGYNSLVHNVHTQILTDTDIKFDSSHFFWLITYFVKFSTQIELDYEHVSSVLSLDMISYLTSQGVYLCEQCELSIKLDTSDIKSNTRRLHLVVTAIREIVQAIEMYQKLSHLSDNDRDVLAQLQIKMGQTEELRSLFVLLLKHYNPKYHRKQYLQDLVVTNHLLILFLDRVMKQPEYKGHYAITEHFKQFATSEIMYQYGLLLEDYEKNGQFVNDCIFTLMHHVAGELGSQICLFQPRILKTFTEIRKSDFGISDDWSDLVGFVINTFVKKPTIIQNVDTKNTDDDKFVTSVPISSDDANNDKNNRNKVTNSGYAAEKDKPDKWTHEELSELNWNYMLCKNNDDIIGNIVKLYQIAGIEKTKGSVIRKLYKQKIINKSDYDSYTREHSDCSKPPSQMTKEREDEIHKFCEQLTNDGKSKTLGWVQKVLLDICNVKIHIEKKALDIKNVSADNNNILNFVLFKKKLGEAPLTSPVAYHNLLLRRSIPLVPWNCEQAASCKDLKFLQLVNKLGFQMPVDTGHVFICIPWNWSAAHIYNMASKILPIDISTLPFTLADIEESRAASLTPASMDTCPEAKQTQCGKDEKDNIVLDGVKNSNWLELVKQSKECKMISTSLKNQVVVDSVVKKEPEPFYMSSDPMTSTENIYTNEFTADDNLSDCPSSISETASVASDLTRMYVSDEEDNFDKQSVSARDDSSDADRAPPKRQRVS